LIIGASIALLVTIACGGDDGGDAPTLETYLSQVDAVLQESDQQFAELEAQGLTTEDVQNPADAVALWEQARDIISDSLDGLRALDAPEEAGREHEELVVAANNYVHELDAFIGQLKGAQTAEDVRALFEGIPGSPLDEAANRLDTSCLQLQDVGTARAIDVDLGCGE
jgi:hypothetical protein